MLLGTSKKVITPLVPVRLAGYATRTKKFEKVLDDLYVRVHFFKDAEKQIVIIYGDLLWWNSEFVEFAKQKLQNNLNLKPSEIIFTASHNHSGAGTGNNFVPLLEDACTEYLDYLYEQVEKSVDEASKNLEQVNLTVHSGNCGLNVYRRVKTENVIEMKPNYNISADNNLTVLKWENEHGMIKGAIVHYPCHANLSNENFVHSDYVGVALNSLDNAFSNSIWLFWQGCTADIRPNTVLGENFIPQDYDGVKNFAQQFVKCCLNTINNSKGRVLNGSICLYEQDINLPLEQSELEQNLKKSNGKQDDIYTQWKFKIQKKNFRDYEVLKIKKLDLCGYAIYFFNAEVSQSYAKFIRDNCLNALSVCYSDGMIGYICNKEQIINGGYEPNTSALYFALAGTYKQDIEEIIKSAILRMRNI